MDPMIGAGLIMGGSSLLGGAMNVIAGDKASKEDWQRNYDAQKEFAQNSIQWRVQDAQKAGIHPLYAMGNTPGYTPSSSVNTASMGTAIAQAGNQFGEMMGQLGLANMYLQNEKLQSDIMKTNAETAKSMGQTPKTLAPKAPVKVGDRMKTVKGEVSLSPNSGYLNDFKRYGKGWIGYPSKDMLDALSDASIFNPMSLPVAVDAIDSMYRDMSPHFEKVMDSAIPGILKYGKVRSDRSFSSYGRPVYEIEFDKNTPKHIIDAYERLLGL